MFEPPIIDGVKVEWERKGVPGKLTFTTVKIANAGMAFGEGDIVRFYYDDKPVFAGYVFTKKRDKQHHIEVVCYDQLRYFKNKYTYVFENKTATQIVEAMCKDFGLEIGTLENTKFILPAVAEENTAVIDIILSALEDTLTSTGKMFTIYDDFGKVCLRNCSDMYSTTLIDIETARNFDYSSSIDDETYNKVVLYYKDEDNVIQVFNASSKANIRQWGTLQYFEEVKSTTNAQNKAKQLLELYNRKTRSLKITGAFGAVDVRGGTLIPVKLYLGDLSLNNYMVVEKVTHNFKNDEYTMDLTVNGAWEEEVE
jgi:hypothetical protein